MRRTYLTDLTDDEWECISKDYERLAETSEAFVYVAMMPSSSSGSISSHLTWPTLATAMRVERSTGRPHSR